MAFEILVINPGGSSTKIAVFRDRKPTLEETVRHTPAEQAGSFIDQYPLRRNTVIELLHKKEFNLKRLSCVVGRGGPYKPLKSGTYRINDALIEDIKSGNVQTMHPSLFGALIAKAIADPLGIPAFFVDPVSVDEFWEISRYSGLPEIPRKALSHTLNVRMCAKEAARRLNKPYKGCNFLIAHLGTGTTIAAHLRGQQVDATNANEDGPFASQRAGAVPTAGLVELCFSGKLAKNEILDKLQRKGGLVAYLGTDDLKAIEKRIADGDNEAELVLEAMAYQVAKELGAYAVVVKGKIDAVILTGGMAYSKPLISLIKSWIKFLSKKIFVFPGEHEMEALALGALRVLRKEEHEKIYR
jgi:butyrate kinase